MRARVREGERVRESSRARAGDLARGERGRGRGRKGEGKGGPGGKGEGEGGTSKHYGWVSGQFFSCPVPLTPELPFFPPLIYNSIGLETRAVKAQVLATSRLVPSVFSAALTAV